MTVSDQEKNTILLPPIINQHSKISEAGTQKEDHTPSKIVSVLDIDIAKEKDKRDFGTNYTEQDIK